MYALLTTFTLGPGKEELGDKLGAQFSAILKNQKGFKKLTMFRDDATGECGGFSLWESREDAEAAMANTGNELKESLTGVVTGPPKRGVYDIWDVFEVE
ncbi:hypothetical protein JXI42_03035 [bacterium]|nr:hypothetical protein [bacterium]